MQKNNSLTNIPNRLINAYQKINDACKQAKRGSDEVKLMAVSKTKPIDNIIEAYQQGQRIFGENYAQELHQKTASLHDKYPDIEWHYIGPIQSNKTQMIAQSASWIDSLDRIKIATRLNNHALELGKTLNVLIQVNISNSPNKSGVSLSEVPQFAEQISTLTNLTLRGLMAIPDQYEDNNKLIKEFLTLQHCFVTLSQQYNTIDTLSLGMSGDMETAINCGSTMVRLGTAIFGERN